MTEPYDLIVAGAGWFGISSAKAYIETHPDERILVLDASDSFGGTWSANRLYPGLKSNNLVGSYEHPDMPMSEAIYGVKPGDHIPGRVLHRYLTDLATKFGVAERTQFNTKVDTIEPTSSGGWKVSVTALDTKKSRSIETKKLIVATGLTSSPNMPKYPGQDSFTVPFFHAKDFCVQSKVVETAKSVVVVGGAKSAFDVAYAFAGQGDCTVDLVIRPTGQGPVWLCPPYVTPLKRMTEELLHTRFLTWFSPCPWGGEDGYPGIRRFFHGTKLGRLITAAFWTIMSNDVINLNGYNKNELVGKLKPWNSVLWTGSGVSIHNYDTSFFDLVKNGKIRIHNADISSLKDDKVLLDNGDILQTDAVIAATGWSKDPTLQFVNIGEAGLGLPHSVEEKLKLNKKADDEILTMFPALRNQPELRSAKIPEGDPLRLYRFIVPPTMVNTRNLAFAGMVSTVSTSIFATVQALWITAYLDGKLDRMATTDDEVTKEVMLHTQWGKWRYPCGYGARLPDFAFDALCYIDLMLKDLGLRHHRKKGGIAEIFHPYKPTDYAGLIQEWQGLKSGSGR